MSCSSASPPSSAGLCWSLHGYVVEGGRVAPDDGTPPVETQKGSPLALPRSVPNGPRQQPLSPREQEVATLIAQGLTNREIAEALAISERTASNHVQHILNKLGFSSRARIAVWAVAHGLFTVPRE